MGKSPPVRQNSVGAAQLANNTAESRKRGVWARNLRFPQVPGRFVFVSGNLIRGAHHVNCIPIAVCPILDSASFRQLPWASVGFRRLPTTITTYIVGMKTKMYLGGDRGPKFLSRYLPKIRVSSAAYPNFSFRQLPWASVDFRGLPWTMGNHLHIYCRNADINVFRRGA